MSRLQNLNQTWLNFQLEQINLTSYNEFIANQLAFTNEGFSFNNLKSNMLKGINNSMNLLGIFKKNMEKALDESENNSKRALKIKRKITKIKLPIKVPGENNKWYNTGVVADDIDALQHYTKCMQVFQYMLNHIDDNTFEENKSQFQRIINMDITDPNFQKRIKDEKKRLDIEWDNYVKDFDFNINYIELSQNGYIIDINQLQKIIEIASVSKYQSDNIRITEKVLKTLTNELNNITKQIKNLDMNDKATITMVNNTYNLSFIYIDDYMRYVKFVVGVITKNIDIITKLLDTIEKEIE